MNLNMSKFKKLAEDKKSATFQHPDGHKITVAKHVLSAGMRGELSKIPLHYADNPTQVPDPNESNSDQNVSRDSSVDQQRSQAPVTINIAPPQQPNASFDPSAQVAQSEPQQQAPEQPENKPSFNWKEALFGTPISSMENEKILHDPDAPIEARLKILKRMDAQNQLQTMQEDQKAKTISDFNQLAPKYGLQPTVSNQPTSIPAKIPSDTNNETNTTPEVSSDPYGSQKYLDTYTKGLGEQRSGIQEAANAESEIAKKSAPLLDETVKQQQAQMKTYDEHYADLERERQFFQQDLMKQHIDPNRLLKSMGTGQKISLGIGLILGGMGAATTGGSNPALDMLNRSIDNDVKGQMKDMDKGENLLSANMRQFGNLRDATDMTRVMQTDILKNQIASVAAKSNDPLVQARAKQAIGQLDMQSAPVLAQLAMRKTLSQQQGEGSTAAGKINPDALSKQVELMEMSGRIPAEKANKAREEIKILAARQKALDLADQNIKQQAQLQTIGSRLLSPIQSHKQLSQLHAQLTPLIMDAAPSKRLTPESVRQEIEPFQVGFTDNPETVISDMQKIKGYINQQSDATPTLEGLGLYRTPKITEIPKKSKR